MTGVRAGPRMTGTGAASGVAGAGPVGVSGRGRGVRGAAGRPVGLLVVTGHRDLAGLGVGIAVGMLWALWSSPPGYIEKWAGGALGERRTAEQLRRLPRLEWVVVHDR